jgi:hypothetical protein
LEVGKLTWAVGVLSGFCISCALVVATFHLDFGMPTHWGEMGLLFLLTAMFSLPGFLLFRLVFWLAGIKQWFAFALAGAMNGYFALSLFLGHFDLNPVFVLLGLLGGVICWVSEVGIAGSIAVRG